MSGGHWYYESGRIKNALIMIGEDEIVKRRWPQVGQLFEDLGPLLAKCEHDIDWDICGDRSVNDDRDWERARIGEILIAVMKHVPDEWFPRGKWATIQAVQGRIAEPPTDV